MVSENPYQSPETDTQGAKANKALVEQTATREPALTAAVRFFLHMFVAAFLAPAAGGAVYTNQSVARSSPLPPTRAESAVGGFLLLFFIWFMTVPFGLLTYLLAASATRLGVASRFTWMIGGAALGLSFGSYLAF